MVFLYSVLYSENPTYRFVEYLFIGAGAGHLIVMALQSVFLRAIVPISKGNFLYVPPVILGLLMFATLSPKHYWTSRYPVALIVGTGTGLALRATPRAQIIDQVAAAVSVIGKDAFSTFGRVTIMIAAITTILYFIFTREHKGVLSDITRSGRYFMMVGFGVMYGAIVMSRVAVLIPQLQFLYARQTLPATAMSTLLVVAVLAYSLIRQNRTKNK